MLVALQPSFAYRLPIQLQRAGLTVLVATTRSNMVRQADGITAIDLISELRQEADLAECLRRRRPDMVLPADDISGILLRQLHSQHDLAKLIETSLGNPKYYDLAISKTALVTLATDLGIPVPQSIEVSDRTAFEARVAQFTPGALKRDFGWGGMGVTPFRTAPEAEHAWELNTTPLSLASALSWCLDSRSLSPLMMRHHDRNRTTRRHLQRWVDGRVMKRAVFCRAGVVQGGISFVALKTSGLTGPSSVIQIIDHPQMADTTARISQELQLSGAYGFDFIEDTATGQALMLEMNPRAVPALTLGIMENSPYDFAGLLAQTLGLQAKPMPPLPQKTVAFFPDEWLQNPQSPYLQTAFHNVPWDQPKLLHAIINDLRTRSRFRRVRDAIKRFIHGRKPHQ